MTTLQKLVKALRGELKQLYEVRKEIRRAQIFHLRDHDRAIREKLREIRKYEGQRRAERRRKG